MKPLIVYDGALWHCAIVAGRLANGRVIVRHPIGCGFTALQAFRDWEELSKSD